MTTKKRIPAQRPINANRSTSNKRPTNGAKAKAKPSAAAPAHPTKSPGESAVSASAGAPPASAQTTAPEQSKPSVSANAKRVIRAVLGALPLGAIGPTLAVLASWARTLAGIERGARSAAACAPTVYTPATGDAVADGGRWAQQYLAASFLGIHADAAADAVTKDALRSVSDGAEIHRAPAQDVAAAIVAVWFVRSMADVSKSRDPEALDSFAAALGAIDADIHAEPRRPQVIPIADMPDGVHAIATGDRLFVRDAPGDTRPSAESVVRKPADVLRDAARALHAEGATLADDGPRAEIASALVSLAAGKLSWREVVNAAGACGRLAGEAADKADRYSEAEHTSHLVYPLATARALARCSVDLFDALDARFSLPDGLAGIGPDADGLAGEDIDGAAYVETEAPRTASA